MGGARFWRGRGSQVSSCQVTLREEIFIDQLLVYFVALTHSYHISYSTNQSVSVVLYYILLVLLFPF